jgi:hypothetical protein
MKIIAVTLGIGCLMVLFDLSSLPKVTVPGRKSGQTVVTTSASQVVLCKARKRLRDIMPEIPTDGAALHYATAGDWSTHDLVLHIIDRIGPAHVVMATWSITEPAVRHIVAALGDGRLLSLGLLADWRVPQSCPEALQLAKAAATCCRVTSVHAKVAVLHNAHANLCIVGSANLTNNPRIEAGIITVGPVAANFHRRWIEAELRDASPFDMARDSKDHGGDDD